MDLIKYLRSALEDDNGGLSSMRLAVLLVVGQLVFTKVYLLVVLKEPQPWTVEEIGIISAVLFPKAMQRGNERPLSPPAP